MLFPFPTCMSDTSSVASCVAVLLCCWEMDLTEPRAEPAPEEPEIKSKILFFSTSMVISHKKSSSYLRRISLGCSPRWRSPRGAVAFGLHFHRLLRPLLLLRPRRTAPNRSWRGRTRRRPTC